MHKEYTLTVKEITVVSWTLDAGMFETFLYN